MTVTPFTRVQGAAVPFLKDNIDTDVIVRIERLTTLAREALGPYAFESVRFRADGSEDPSCVLNSPEFRGAPILIAGSNFGCGSSREGAVWALMGMGLRCVIAASFGDIFFNNCFQNGVLPVQLPLDQVQVLAAQATAGATFSVDLRSCLITWPDGAQVPFTVDPLRRTALLEGLDAIGLTMRDDAQIRAWQAADRARRPWAWPGEAH